MTHPITEPRLVRIRAQSHTSNAMEGDLAVERGEGSKPEHAPSSDETDSVKVEGHACDTIRKKSRFLQELTIVSMATLQHYATQCSACCLLLHAIDANLPGTHREEACITVRGYWPYTDFYVSGVSADDGSVVQSDRFQFFTPSGMSLSLEVAKKTMAEKEKKEIGPLIGISHSTYSGTSTPFQETLHQMKVLYGSSVKSRNATRITIACQAHKARHSPVVY